MITLELINPQNAMVSKEVCLRPTRYAYRVQFYVCQ